MGCGEERVTLPNKPTAAGAVRAVTPQNHGLHIVKAPGRPQLPTQASGIRFRSPITGRLFAQRSGLHLV
jgi:hypothetical protein